MLSLKLEADSSPRLFSLSAPHQTGLDEDEATKP